MKSFLAGAAVSAVMLAGAAAPAYAVTITPGPSSVTFPEGQQSSPLDQFGLGRPTATHLPASGTTFTDYYTFTVGVPTEINASYTLSGFSNTPTGVTLALFSGSVGSGTEITSVSAEGVHLDYTGLMAGTSYYLQVSGLSKGPGGGYGGTASFQSAVPLPNSVALFGVAIAGLGVAGAARRRSVKAPAV